MWGGVLKQGAAPADQVIRVSLKVKCPPCSWPREKLRIFKSSKDGEFTCFIGPGSLGDIMALPPLMAGAETIKLTFPGLCFFFFFFFFFWRVRSGRVRFLPQRQLGGNTVRHIKHLEEDPSSYKKVIWCWLRVQYPYVLLPLIIAMSMCNHAIKACEKVHKRYSSRKRGSETSFRKIKAIQNN